MSLVELNCPYPASMDTIRKKLAKYKDFGYNAVFLNTKVTESSGLNRTLDFNIDAINAIARPLGIKVFRRATLEIDDYRPLCTPETHLNKLLASVDLVAVTPLTQTALEYCCKLPVVNVICIKLRLQTNVRIGRKLAISAEKLGICFEMVYSDLFGDPQLRSRFITYSSYLQREVKHAYLLFSHGSDALTTLRNAHDLRALLKLIVHSDKKGFGILYHVPNALLARKSLINH